MTNAAPLAERLNRKFHELRPHVPQRNAALDDLCAVAVAATQCTECMVTLCNADTHFVVGGSNTRLTTFPRMFDMALTEQFYEHGNLDQHPDFVRLMQAVGGDVAIRSCLVTPIHVDKHPVGMFGLASSLPEGAFSPLDRALLFRLARVAEGLIRSEVSLSRVVRQTLATIAEDQA